MYPQYAASADPVAFVHPAEFAWRGSAVRASSSSSSSSEDHMEHARAHMAEEAGRQAGRQVECEWGSRVAEE